MEKTFGLAVCFFWVPTSKEATGYGTFWYFLLSSDVVNLGQSD
jgi:hypothetical protein